MPMFIVEIWDKRAISINECLLTAKDLPLLAALKSLFFDSVVNGPLGIP